MAIKGINMRETEEYILHDDPGHEDHADYKAAIAADKEPEKPTVFKIGNLSQGDRIEIGDMTTSPSMKDGEIKMTTQRVRRAYKIVCRGLKGWTNFLDENGAAIPFTTETDRTASGAFSEIVSEKSMRALSQSMIVELSGAILDKNGMRSDLEKKFDGASQLQGDPLSEIGGVPIVPPVSSSNEGVQVPQSESSESQNTGSFQTARKKTGAPADT